MLYLLPVYLYMGEGNRCTNHLASLAQDAVEGMVELLELPASLIPLLQEDVVLNMVKYMAFSTIYIVIK